MVMFTQTQTAHIWNITKLTNLTKAKFKGKCKLRSDMVLNWQLGSAKFVPHVYT